MDSDLEKILSEIGNEIDDEVDEDSSPHFEYHEDDEFVNENKDSEIEEETRGKNDDSIKSDEIETADLEDKINEQVHDTLEKQKVESSPEKIAVSEFTTKGTKLWNTRDPVCRVERLDEYGISVAEADPSTIVVVSDLGVSGASMGMQPAASSVTANIVTTIALRGEFFTRIPPDIGSHKGLDRPNEQQLAHRHRSKRYLWRFLANVDNAQVTRTGIHFEGHRRAQAHHSRQLM